MFKLKGERKLEEEIRLRKEAENKIEVAENRIRELERIIENSRYPRNFNRSK